nr:hypothetical protein [Tanacetum cinerariifolium]
MFWHNARDDPMFNMIRGISRHQDTQVYSAILPDVSTNQEMLDSKAYKEYYVVASGAVHPKAKTKYKKKTDEPVTSPKSKTASASKHTKLKSKAKVTKLDMKKQPVKKTKAKGLAVLSKTEYEEKDIDEGVRTPSGDEFTNEEKLDDEETMDDEEDDEVRKELYKDVNVNLEKVMLRRPMLIKEVDEPVQSSSVSSGFTSKFLNLENPSLGENEIASLMETLAPHATTILEITLGFTTTTSPLPPFFNPPLQQQTPTIPTPTFTTITPTYPTVTLLEIPNFASVFKFDQRVTTLESELTELKQTNQFVEVVSLILGIVDKYLVSKMNEVVNVVVQLQTNKLREEAQAENQDFLNQVDLTMKKIIKDQVKEQVSKMMPKIDKYVTKTLGAEVCPWSEPSHTIEESGMKQDQDFLIRDNNEQPVDKKVTKADCFKKPERHLTPNSDWNLEYLKGGDSSRRHSTSVMKIKSATYELKWIEDLVLELWSPVKVNYDKHAYFGTSYWVTRLTIMKKYDYGYLEEIEVRRDDQQLNMFKEGDFKRLHLQDIEDMLLLLIK